MSYLILNILKSSWHSRKWIDCSTITKLISSHN